MAACSIGHLDTAKLMIKHGADINIYGTADGSTCLKKVAWTGNNEFLQYLIDVGAKTQVNMQDYLGHTPLIMVCHRGFLETAKILVANGADVHIQANDGMGCLKIAAAEGQTEICQYLLWNGAKVNLQDEDGYPAVMYSCQNGWLQTAKMLVSLGADVGIIAKNGMSCLISAALGGHFEIVQWLVTEMKQTVHHQHENGGSALIEAASKGHTETCKYLIEKGAEVDLQNGEGFTAFMMAC